MTPHYRKAPDWLEASVQDELLMMHADTQLFVSLNETGAFLWSLLNEPRDAATLAQLLSEEFEVAPATARSDIERWLADMLARNLIENDAA